MLGVPKNEMKEGMHARGEGSMGAPTYTPGRFVNAGLALVPRDVSKLIRQPLVVHGNWDRLGNAILGRFPTGFDGYRRCCCVHRRRLTLVTDPWSLWGGSERQPRGSADAVAVDKVVQIHGL